MGNIRDLAIGQVATAPSPQDSGLTLILGTGQGDDMPDVPFKALAYPPDVIPTKYNAERILVTDVTGDTLTFTRAQGETTAQNIAVGWFVGNSIFVEDMFNGSVVENEVPGGAVNGSNTVFTIASAGKVTGTLKVYKNGQRLKGGGIDYTETATGFTTVSAPSGGAVLLVDYRVSDPADYSVGTNSSIFDEAVSGSVNGSNTAFTTARPYVAGSLEVYVNGLKQAKTLHVTEVSPAAGTFSLDVAPQTGDVVRVNYQFNLNPSGNTDTVDGYHASTINQAFSYGVRGETRKYTSNDTWSKPAGLKFVIVEVVGAGGGSGGAASTSAQTSCGGGGGGGGYSMKRILAASLGGTETVTVGTGGTAASAGANNGGTGVTSSFGSHCQATGGVGGGGGAAGTDNQRVISGSGGAGSGGDLNIEGSAGGPGLRLSSRSIGGRGGATQFSGGGEDIGGGSTSATTAAVAGKVYGGGASGGQNSGTQSAIGGAAGAAGIVIVHEYF